MWSPFNKIEFKAFFGWLICWVLVLLTAIIYLVVISPTSWQLNAYYPSGWFVFFCAVSLAFPLGVLPVFLYQIWKAKEMVWIKIVATIFSLALLYPWYLAFSLTIFFYGLASIPHSIGELPVRATNCQGKYSIQIGATLVDDDTGTDETIFSLYQNFGPFSKLLSRTSGPTRCDLGLPCIELQSSETAVKFEYNAESTQLLDHPYLYKPASNELICL